MSLDLPSCCFFWIVKALRSNNFRHQYLLAGLLPIAQKLLKHTPLSFHFQSLSHFYPFSSIFTIFFLALLILYFFIISMFFISFLHIFICFGLVYFVLFMGKQWVCFEWKRGWENWERVVASGAGTGAQVS